MPIKKMYTVVTNDEMEIPIKSELHGAKEAADFIGVTVQVLRKSIHDNRWSKKYKYKAIIDDDYIPEDSTERKKRYSRKYAMTHDRREYYRKYRMERKENAYTEKS